MSVTLCATGPLRGAVDLPGDPRVALSALAFGMFTGASIILHNVPDSPDIDSFCAFLERLGAQVTRDETILSVILSEFPSQVDIDRHVPEAVMHQVIAGSVFAADRVTVRGGAADREVIAGKCLKLLAPAGLRSARISHEGDDLVIPHVTFDPDGIDEVRSAWELEAVLAASCSSSRPVRIAYPPSSCAQILNVSAFFGCTGAALESTGVENRDLELTRRLARVRGIRSSQTSVFEWSPVSVRPFVLPGDGVVAGALAICAALHPRSKLIIRGTVWEQDRRGLFDALKRMKAPVSWMPSKQISALETADLTAAWGPFEGVQITADQSARMWEEQFLLVAAASYAAGRTVISADTTLPTIDRARFRCLAENLGRMGVHVGDFADGIVLNGIPELRGAAVDADGDELIALTLGCAALAASGKTELSGIPGSAPRLDAFLDAVKSVTGLQLS